MRTIILVSVLIGVPSMLAAQTPLSLPQCLDAIVRFETAFRGKTVTIQSGNRKRFNDEEIQVSIGNDDRFCRVFHTFTLGERLQRVELCVAGSQLVEAIEIKADAGSEPHRYLTGMLEFDFHAASIRALGSYLCGVSQIDGVRFSKILDQGEATLKCEPGSLVGFDETFQKLIGHHPKYGEYVIWLTLDDRPLVKHIHILKRTGNYILDSVHEGPTTIGAPPYVGRQPDKNLQARLEAEAAKFPRETEREIVVGPIEYEFLDDGTAYPKSLEIKSTSRYRDRSEFALQLDERVVGLQSFHCVNPEIAQFEKVKVHDGMPVQVAGQVGAAYEFRGGKIVRMVDVDSVARMDGVRYRKPPSSSWRYVVLVFIGAVALAILLRNRFRRG